MLNILLWVLQILPGIFFIFNGVNHYTLPPNLPAPFQWMYDLPQSLHIISGTAEILGGLGLILPGLTKIQTQLIPLAAAGLALVMVGAFIFHLPRGEYANIVQNIILGGLAVFVAYRRWKANPLPDRSSN